MYLYSSFVPLILACSGNFEEAQKEEASRILLSTLVRAFSGEVRIKCAFARPDEGLKLCFSFPAYTCQHLEYD